MRKEIHPEWYTEARVICQCGNTWTTGATVPEIRTEICSACHPFFTGEQRIVDTEGRVDAFMNRLAKRDQMKAQKTAKKGAEQEPLADVAVKDFKLDKRYKTILQEANFNSAQDILQALAERGDEAILEIDGIGLQVLSDLKKRLREQGFEIPEAAQTDAASAEAAETSE